MLKEVIIFIIACFALVKSAEYAVKASARIARFFSMTEFVTSFIFVAVVSSFPEGFISVISAIKGDPQIGVGTLLGGNIADITLILGLVALAGHPIKITSAIVKRDLYLVVLLMLPILLGLNGVISRIDGLILLSVGVIFMMLLLREKQHFPQPYNHRDHALKHATILLASIGIMLLSAHFVVQSTHSLAVGLGVPSLLIGLILVALGTTLPEFTFSLQSIRKGHGDMAVGDLLGAVIVDACIIMGITALITPIAVNVFALSVIGMFTLLAIVFALIFMRTDGILTKNEALTLVFFYLAFVVVQVLLR